MTPRSEEFMAGARERLASARLALDADYAASATSLAYYAMLYAARAALSEDDRYAKTHSGTWSLFREVFVATERFDSELARAASDSQRLREAGDYEAAGISVRQAEEVVELAGRFVAAIAEMLGG